MEAQYCVVGDDDHLPSNDLSLCFHKKPQLYLSVTKTELGELNDVSQQNIPMLL